MIFTEFNLKQALNKAFLKQHIGSEKINLLAQCLRDTAQKINIHESEAYHKNLIRDFLNKVYYDPNFTINTKDYNDLVIYNGNMPTSSIGVIIETKRPAEKYDMVSSNSMNTKALHELILYFLRERITNKNLELKHLIITNLYHWFIFDVRDFETIFAQNKNLVHLYQSFESKQLSGTKTEYFYKEIAENFVTNNPAELKFTVLDFQNFINLIPKNAEDYESQLTLLYKILSPEHLLKLPFANDSNSLNTAFYHELLHIIGLAEITDKGKSLIQRLPAKHRNSGSFIENTISQLDSLDKLSRFPNLQNFGNTSDEQLFNIALELSITWINRILFLKLLEAQLMVYHKHSTK
ncbi:MAG: type II restriction endonuclease, partial [Alphaproteobacteria bacterium]|nr:type II restriction endonuclease [Alphaproteobacteria bacterium]